ncbi:GH25 family lysozyme [Bifidobacterium sp. ESL0745]|uniref:GH25 family lysozyme n=1 Tax=Bifidobacterium sp. ESL0745 TaxID=2983226 RepID=UPI0023F9B225|nr:GH25 family lysozyme [Bifidobacterium sp. ESL0745]MDF7665746.1 GH25 family lysozyme [Bifidobacterium sp. ESL0745]
MTLRIVDVSNYKPDFDPALADCDGVVVQCTWGAGELTHNRIVNSVWPGANPIIQKALKAGKAVGYMHYIRGRASAEDEARFFAANTVGYLHRFVPSVDWEAGDNQAYPDVAYLDRWLAAYIGVTGVHPLIYRGRKDAGSVDPIARKHDCGVWDADYALPEPEGWQEHPWNEAPAAMRQFTSKGYIGGYDKPLDLDLFYGDRSAWDRYAAGSESISPQPAPAPAPAAIPQVAVDGACGPDTVRRWQQVMGTPADGIISGQVPPSGGWAGRPALNAYQYGRGGSDLIHRVQAVLDLPQDGLLGPDTVRGIQARLGTAQDGVFGPATVKALQTRLNQGTF